MVGYVVWISARTEKSDVRFQILSISHESSMIPHFSNVTDVTSRRFFTSAAVIPAPAPECDRIP
jgi:hypothetical protein